MYRNSAAKKNKSFSAIWVVIAVLLMVEVLATSMLVAQLSSFSAVKERNYISLTEGSEQTRLSISKKNVVAAAVRNETETVTLSNVVPGKTSGVTTLAAAPVSGGREAAFDAGVKTVSLAAFEARDKDTVWSTETHVEIFRIRYDNNGDLVYTVNSENGDRVIAPGTENTYEFTLRNTGSVALDYRLTVESYFTGEDNDGNPVTIPVDARMREYTGEWLVGGADSWPDVLELNKVDRAGVLGAGMIADYALDWRWPFERGTGDELKANDAFDTSLGNLAVDKDLELHIIIRTVAEADENPETTGGEKPPQTGDDYNFVMWIVLAAVCLVLIIFLIIFKRRRDDDEEETEAAPA